MTPRIGKISGGTGSWAAVRRSVDRYGTDGLHLLFTDTLLEDQDAYRFLIASVSNLLGVKAPDLPEIEDFPAWEDRVAYKTFVLKLRDETVGRMPAFHWIADGRDPWEVFEDVRLIGSSRFDPCSKLLKRSMAEHWIRDNQVDGATIIIGIDHEEDHRLPAIQRVWGEKGWTVEAPLCDPPFLSWSQRQDWLKREGLWLPRLNRLGFSHNNCGGFCCKGGHGHFQKMFEVFPERYAWVQSQEERLLKKFGRDHTMMRCRRGGTSKPLSMGAFRSRIGTGTVLPEESADQGGCNCFTGEVA